MEDKIPTLEEENLKVIIVNEFNNKQEKNNPISIQKYFKKGIFVIPNYQRGYKWSVKEKDDQDSSLEYFIKSLKNSFENKLDEYFIEAVTVVEKEKNVILVDGQQRTTSLFLLFAVLEDFEFIKEKLVYAVRNDSKNWLNNIQQTINENIQDEDTQDIFYFKKAIEQIRIIVEDKNFSKDDFKTFVLEKVKLLYNEIPEEKAVNTFIALNGLKAIMKDEELIKSDLLIKSSRMDNKTENQVEQFGIEWKINEDRSRLARNWDKWLYWWNQQEVKNYFGTENRHPLYYLLVTYWNINPNNENAKFSFENFKNKFISDAKSAKTHFEGLRKLQKTFEDLYNDWERYNLLGLAFLANINKNECIKYFIENTTILDELKRFTKWALAECTLSEIKEMKEEKFKERKENLSNILIDKNLFDSDGKGQAYLQLLRMNVMDMNERKFDFEVFKTKSLEHICPQNPPEDNSDFIKTKKEIEEKSDSINSIGNLVLLNGSANSSLSNNPYYIKKQLLFDKIKQGFLLPHTLKVFSKSFNSKNENTGNRYLFNNEKYWQADDVENNKEYFFNEFEKYYGK